MKKGYPFISSLEAICFSLVMGFLSIVLVASILVKVAQ